MRLLFTSSVHIPLACINHRSSPLMCSSVSGAVFPLPLGLSEYPAVNWIISCSYASFSSPEIVGTPKAENGFIRNELNYATTTTSKSELLKQKACFSFSLRPCTSWIGCQDLLSIIPMVCKLSDQYHLEHGQVAC